MNEETKARLREILAVIRERRTDTRRGICWHMHTALGEIDIALTQRRKVNNWVRDAFSEWPKSSGDNHYPVPDGDMNPEVAFDNTEDLWDPSTEYGRNRYELLDFLIQEAEKIVCNCTQ